MNRVIPDDPKKRSLSGGGGGTPAGAAAPSGPAQQAPAAPQQQAQQQPGTGFVNLQRVLEANRQGAQQMGNQLAGQVRQQGQQAQQGIQQGAGAFTAATLAKSNELAFRPDATPALAPVAANVYGKDRLAAEEARAAEADRLAARTYAGPKSWQDAGVDEAALTAQVAKANDAANAVVSAGGRAALLRERNPNLTAGGSALDGFLSGQGMGAQAQELKAGFGGLADALKAERAKANPAYETALAGAKDASGRYSGLAAEIRAGRDAEAARQQARYDEAAFGPIRRGEQQNQRRGEGEWTWEEQERRRDIKDRARRGEEP